MTNRAILPLCFLCILPLTAIGLPILYWINLITTGIPTYLFWAIFLSIPVAVIFSFAMPQARFSIFLQRIGACTTGFMIYLILTLSVGALVYFICRLTHLMAPLSDTPVIAIRAGYAVLAVIASIYIYGIFQAFILRTTSYEISLSKQVARPLRIAMIADLHIGITTGYRTIGRIAEKINSLQPDLVVIAGDIFDDNYNALRWPEETIHQFRTIKSRLGVYACLGNHDMFRDDSRCDDFFQRSGIHVLCDESVLLDDSFYLCGRHDYSTTSRKKAKSITDDLDHNKPIIMLDHQPNCIYDEWRAGVDLVCCGHTHNGQFFPINLMYKFINFVSYGHKSQKSQHVIVTSGAGFWGPPLRVGTFNEVVCIDITSNDHQA